MKIEGAAEAAPLLYGKAFYNTGRYLYFYGMRNRVG